MSMTDNAATIASSKLAGKPIADVKQKYVGQPASALTLPLVDKVYGDQFTNVWDYSVAFYRDCASNMANIQIPRSDMATFCMQNVMIATTAFELKSAGVPRKKAYERYAKMGSTPIAIVDGVYDQTGTRVDAAVHEWNSCMSSFVPQ